MAVLSASDDSRADRSRRRVRRIAFAVLLIAALAVPVLFPSYRVFQITTMITDAIALLGLNMLTGYNG